MEELVEEAKKGNIDAFSQLIRLEKGNLYKIAVSRMKTIEDAEDVLQETVFQAYVRIDKLRKNQSFRSWIRKILIAQINTFYKKNKRKQEKIKEKLIENYQFEPMSNIVKTEYDIDFKRFLQTLKGIDRTIVLLYYNDLYTMEEISETLNMNLNTVKTKLSRAKQKMNEFAKRGEKIG